jgi:dihydrofolate reductase
LPRIAVTAHNHHQKEQAMTPHRKIIVSIATSADGYIARPDGNVDWLNRPRTAGDYGMTAFVRSIDTILWGRKTYDFAVQHGGVGMFGLKVKNYVFSTRPPQSPPTDVTFVNEPVADFVQRLRSEPGKNIWMMGGAGIIGSFLDAGALDEFIIHVIPIFIGDGIRLAAPGDRNAPVTLKSVRKYADGVVRLHYAVDRKVTGVVKRKKSS